MGVLVLFFVFWGVFFLGGGSFIFLCIINKVVKYKRTDALSLWHQQSSTTMKIIVIVL